MTRPRLPAATVIDGRSLYTAGDMRAYYDLALSSTHDEFEYPDDTEITPGSGSGPTDSVDDLMKMFGMKK